MKRFVLSLFAASLFFSLIGSVFAEAKAVETSLESRNANCGYEFPGEIFYDVEIVSIRKKYKVEEDEQFPTTVFFRNMGNTPLKSDKSDCKIPTLFLGTDSPRDRAGIFYEEGLRGWHSENRISMDQMRVDPGEIGSFSFLSQAGDADAYKEYFTPVVKGGPWLEDDKFEYKVVVGDTGENRTMLRHKFQFAGESGSVLDIDIAGTRSAEIDISEQKMKLMIEDRVVREYPISSGAYATPTPIEEGRILFKQDVRIGGAAPHYIMPNFIGVGYERHNYRFTGYGFHALPSLGSASLRNKIRALQSDGKVVPTSLFTDDVMWSEAHDHIGKRASHGCIRVLPEDAKFLQDFVHVGMEFNVVE